MGKNTSIAWCDHTFNPWWGCTKVSQACTNCYAERDSKRYGFKIWGDNAERRFFGDDHWKHPLDWNRWASTNGRRARVFCASMADIFEDRPDLIGPRGRVFDTIKRTRNLIWLLLTKRLDEAAKFIPALWWDEWPDNVMLGCTVENNATAEERIPKLLRLETLITRPARTFLSCEPLFEELDLEKFQDFKRIGWIICGGESGPGSRPMHPNHPRQLLLKAAQFGIPFFFKQWGDSVTVSQAPSHILLLQDDKLGPYYRVGKKNAGALIDGKPYKEFPTWHRNK